MPVLVGTSGWQYRHWRERFYPPRLPPAAWLEYYAERFATVEINNTFYNLPRPHVFEAWAQRTPDDFVFVVKASRYLTHVKRLREPRESVDRLMEGASRLGAKLGAVLIQLPPSLEVRLDALEETLGAFPASVRLALEPRHRSWLTDEVRHCLERRGAALSLVDRLNRRGPIWRTSDWTYLRLHEGRARPRPCYGEAALASWAARLASGWTADEDAYVFFNNDPAGCAVRDAAIFARTGAAAALRPTRTPDPASVRVG